MKVGVVGTGYVGLVTGVSFADHGNEVVCVDIDPEKVAMMQAGVPPIYEDGLEAMMNRNIKEGRLRFTTDLKEGVLGAAAVFLALPTPESEDGSADLKYILGVADDIGGILVDYTVIVNKSTVPVGTAEQVHERIAAKTDVPFDVVSNPEFLREGRAVRDVRTPDRIVIGSDSQRAREVMSELYEPYVQNERPIRFMSNRSAELTKYGANGFLATKIAFNNELARLADSVGADIKDVLAAMGDDERITHQFMHPSSGWGGSCFPKDSRALISIGEGAGVDMMIMRAADESNDRQKTILPEKIIEHFDGDIKGKKFALWGLAFKKDTDDVRESPALEFMEKLLAAGAEVVAYDPAAMDNVKKRYKDAEALHFAETQYDALTNADALVIATDWEAFSTADLARIKKELNQPLIFDGRIMMKPRIMKAHGFHYVTIGRKEVRPDVD